MVKPLKKTKLLAVEGTDEVIFFEELFKHIGMLDKVELREVGGKDQFKIKMPTLQKTTGFNNLDAIGIIRDADENFESAFESIKGVFEKMGIQVPARPGQFSDGVPKVGIFIMPDNANKGMLENLCLNTVKDDQAMECVDQFINCAKELKKQPKNAAKTKAQAYLALMPEIANSVGRGAQKGYWNFNSRELIPLINFINQLIHISPD
jgi:hypothetical protein